MSATPTSSASTPAAQSPTMGGLPPGRPPGIIPVNLPDRPRFPQPEPIDHHPGFPPIVDLPPGNPPPPPINDDPPSPPPGQPTGGTTPVPPPPPPRPPQIDPPNPPPVVQPEPPPKHHHHPTPPIPVPVYPGTPIVVPGQPTLPLPPPTPVTVIPSRPTIPNIPGNPWAPNVPVAQIPSGPNVTTVTELPIGPTRVSQNTNFGGGYANSFPMAGGVSEGHAWSEPTRTAVAVAQPVPHVVHGAPAASDDVAPKPVGFASVSGQCQDVPVKITKHKRGVSFLFIADTSASLVKAGNKTRERGQLTQVAHGMPAFFRRLPQDLDYRAAVLLAHGPKSPWFGRLFQMGKNDPAVLRRDKMSEAEIVRNLEQKMMNVPNDSSDAQGEASILAMYEITSHREKTEAARDAGLFEKGRDVIVISVTDEQDVCFDYTGSGFEPVHKLYTKHGKQVEMPDPIEARFFNQVCKPFLQEHQSGYFPKAERDHALNYNDAIEAFHNLEKSLDAKVMMNAIVYTTPQPPLAHDERDAEMAHGILELVAGMNTGVAANLDHVDRSNNSVAFANELSELGESASFQLSYSSGFDCKSNDFHPDSIDTDQVELQILDHGQPIARYLPHCVTGQDCRDADGRDVDGALSWRIEGSTKSGKRGLRVYPADQEGFARLLRGQKVQEPTARIVFKTRQNVDPKTGLKTSGKRVDGPTSHGPIPTSSTVTSQQPMSFGRPSPLKPVPAVTPKTNVAPKPGAALKTATPAVKTAAKPNAAPVVTAKATTTPTKVADPKTAKPITTGSIATKPATATATTSAAVKTTAATPAAAKPATDVKSAKITKTSAVTKAKTGAKAAAKTAPKSAADLDEAQ